MNIVVTDFVDIPSAMKAQIKEGGVIYDDLPKKSQRLRPSQPILIPEPLRAPSYKF